MEGPRSVLVVAWNAEDEALRVGVRMALDANALLYVLVPKVKISPFVFLAPGGASVPGALDREAERNLWRILASIPPGASVTGRVQALSAGCLRDEVTKGCHDAVVIAGGRPAALRRRQIRKLERVGLAATVHVVQAPVARRAPSSDEISLAVESTGPIR